MDHNLFARLIFSSAMLFAVAFGGCGGDGSTTSTGGTAACRDGQTECDGICVNTANDNTNCGSCGNACAPGEICNGSGSCALSCQTGLTDCNGTCVNTNSDNAHCGDCTTACNAGEVCNGSGSCALSCQTGLTDCNGTCVNPNTDEAWCGAGPNCSVNAGTACQPGESCEAGVCTVVCPSTQIECDGLCVSPLTDQIHCGAGPDCSTNPGTTCQLGENCLMGVCVAPCASNEIRCDGSCIDPVTDENYCGAGPDCSTNPGMTCLPGESCSMGVCVTCTSTEVECNGVCCDAESSCKAGVCEPMVTNGSFETGDFTGWTVQDLSSPFWPLAVYPSGQQSWPFFSTTPTDGQYVAATGFDGDGASSGFPISIGQDIAVQGTTVMLTFDYRAAWDLTFGATVPRTFGIQIEPAGGGSPIDSIVLLTAAPNTTVNDTGDQLGQIDLSPYAGQTVFVRWTWVVPQDYTGPGMVQVDNVRALRQ